jgi:hypothetical protein
MRLALITMIALLLLAMPLMAQDGSILLEDDFSDPTSGWDEAEFDAGSIGYGDGFYSVSSTEVAQFMWGASGNSFSNVVIEVETTQVLSPKNGNNGYGVMCRIQENGDGYALRISGDGYASITMIEDGEFVVLVDWTLTDAIVQGDGSNELNVVCNGSNLMIYVNGEFVMETDDDTFTEGDIAFAVTTFEESATEIRFDNLSVTAVAGDDQPGKPGPKGGGDVVDNNTPPDYDTALEDDFSDSDSGWEIGDYDTGIVGYGDGYYMVSSLENGQFMWGLSYRNFTDIILDVEATQSLAPNNDNNGYGVMCRVQPNDDGYALFISGDGYSSIFMIENNEFVTLVDWEFTDAVVLGSNTNSLRAVCDGDNLQLFVNGTLTVSTTDDTFADGDIALAAITFEDEITEIHFTNLSVTSP